MYTTLPGTLIIAWLAACQIYTAAARFGFLKDQSIEATFPMPVYIHPHASLPAGHLMPLGQQRRPDSPIHEVTEMPGIREFFEKYVKPSKPAVFRQSVTQAPAYEKWTDKYLTEKYGSINVTVRVKIARRRSLIVSETKVIKMRKFIYDYMYDDLYLASLLPKQMMPDLPLPKCLRCGTLSENLVTAELWMSGGGTSSQIHSHDNHLIHCVIFGRRDFILIENMHKHAFSWIDDFPGSLGGHSDIDTERVNTYVFKQILRVPWIWSTLYPGDCLFVPAGYLHQVRSHGRSVSTTVEFFPVNEFDDSGCELKEKDFIPMSDAYFLMEMANGRTRLRDTELNVERLRHILISLTDKSNVLTQEKFEHFYKQVLGEDPALPSPTSVFNMLKAGEQQEHLSKTSLLSLGTSILQKVADIFNSVHVEMENTEQALADEEASATTDDTGSDKHEEF
ncbi:hypothetical protein BsWGS_23312 [Bradybaena similaris]